MKITEADAWELLELDRGSDKPTIRQAYLDLVSVWHPDRFRGKPRLEAKALERLTRINAAYDLLYQAAEHRVQLVGGTRSAPGDPAPPTPEERRSSPRVKLRIPVHFRSTLELGFHPALDLGRGGIVIGTPQPLDRDESIPLRFLVPGSKSHIFAEARVVWATPAIGMGLQFGDLKPTDRATIAAFVNDYASTDGIVIVCSQCGTLLKVALRNRRRVVRCLCKHEFTIP